MTEIKKHATGMGFIGGSTKYPIYKKYEPQFIGLSKKKASSLEATLKENYEIKDYQEMGERPGYEITDKRTNESYFFSPNARLTLETRYLEKNEEREVTENVLDLLTRVAVNIATADLKYNNQSDIISTAGEFLEVMLKREFEPNTPTLCNAGRELGQLSACFVLPVEDYIGLDDVGKDPEKQGNGIFDAAKYMALIHKSGGGTGFNFSRLRPKYDRICTTFGSSSGPISFIKAPFDASTDAINQGGFRRGANMGILEYWHPDIFEFVHEKLNGTLQNFNLSVGLDEDFMEKVIRGGYFRLINPKNQLKLPLEERVYKSHSLFKEKRFEGELSNDKLEEKEEYQRNLNEIKPSLLLSADSRQVINAYNNKVVGKIDDNGSVLIEAKLLFDYIIECAHKTGCPGLVFIDRLNRDNPTPHVSKIESTNPCGEQPLLPYEACNLGSINLAKCVMPITKKASSKAVISEYEVDFNKLKSLVRIGVHFLDNVIDKNKYPVKKIHYVAKGNRKIGLGVMGFADLLYKLSIPYDSKQALELGENLMKFITEKAVNASEDLAETRGAFPNFKGSIYDPESEFYKKEKKGRPRRNATVTTIAPTGTISMIADASGGIEPVFALYFKKNCMDGRKLVYRNPEFESAVAKRGLNLEELAADIKANDGINNVGVDLELKAIYKTAHEISPIWHIKMQAAFQRQTENAVSKTVNLPTETTVSEFKEIYLESWKNGCKGVTAFRDKCKEKQVLEKENEKIPRLVRVSIERPNVIEEADGCGKYKISRPKNKDSLHIIFTDELYVDRKNNLAYLLPREDFQNRAPLGEETTVDFAQEGMDRSEMLKGPNPNYAEYIKRWKSTSSDDDEGIGPRRIKSKHYAVALCFEYHLLENGVVGYDESNNLVNLVRKAELELVKDKEEKELILGNNKDHTNGTRLTMNIAGSIADFKCEECGSTSYFFEAACHSPKCSYCGWTLGNCG